MNKYILSFCMIISAMLAAQDFEDDFTRVKSLSNGNEGYVIWGNKCYVNACSHDPETGRKAPGSIKIQADDFQAPATGFLVRFLPIELKKGYNLMIYVRKHEVSPDTGIQIRMLGKDNRGKNVYQHRSLSCDNFQDDVWQRLIVALPPIPEGGEKKITIEFGTTSMSKGTIWFDDLEFFADEE